MKKVLKNLIQSKVFIFSVQILLLTLLIFLLDHHFPISFDENVSSERQDIIQFLANYVIYGRSSSNIIFTVSTWLLVSLFPILLYKDYKRSYSMNLTTFFFPNFFFYVFYSRYSPDAFNEAFWAFFFATILLGVLLVAVSLGGTFLLKKATKRETEKQKRDIQRIFKENESTCPHCGTSFHSVPKYCYHCSKEIAQPPK